MDDIETNPREAVPPPAAGYAALMDELAKGHAALAELLAIINGEPREALKGNERITCEEKND